MLLAHPLMYCWSPSYCCIAYCCLKFPGFKFFFFFKYLNNCCLWQLDSYRYKPILYMISNVWFVQITCQDVSCDSKRSLSLCILRFVILKNSTAFRGIHSPIHQRLDSNYGSLCLSQPIHPPLPPQWAAGGSCSEWLMLISYSLIQMELMSVSQDVNGLLQH